MTAQKLCAVVVTFRPGPEVLENLATLRPQVDALVVVDNTSRVRTPGRCKPRRNYLTLPGSKTVAIWASLQR